MRRFPWSPFLALLLTAILFRGWTALPLGIPGEWTWERIQWMADNRAETLWGVCLAVIAGALYVGFAIWGAQHFPTIDGLRKSPRNALRAGLWLCGLWIVANGWVLALQQSPPEPYNLTKAAWVTYYPATSGYFYHARYRISELSSFLDSYEAWMKEGDVLHVGTHPPGLYLFNLAWLRVCERSPAITDLLLATTPNDIVRGINEIDSRLQGSPHALSNADRAALWGIILFTQGVALATIFPLYGVAKLHFSRKSAWQVATLWPTIPALAVFLPKSDALYPFITLLLVWCAILAVRRKSWWWGCCAGFVLWFGLMMSLALLPGLVLSALLITWELFVTRRSEPASTETIPSLTKTTILSLVVMGTTFVLLITTFWWLADLNLLNCWRLNLQNHAGFYDQYHRTYWKWLFVNPLELAFALGLPVTFAIVSWYGRGRANFGRLPNAAWGPLICCPAVWGLLWISGKNLGEAARLWIFLLPWGLWILAPRLNARADKPHRAYGYLWLLIAQMLAAIVTVTGVSGFHLLEV